MGGYELILPIRRMEDDIMHIRKEITYLYARSTFPEAFFTLLSNRQPLYPNWDTSKDRWRIQKT